jgi:hypothetical protein
MDFFVIIPAFLLSRKGLATTPDPAAPPECSLAHFIFLLILLCPLSSFLIESIWNDPPIEMKLIRR